MKKTIISLFAGLAALIGAGCHTTSTTGTPPTAVWNDTNFVDKVSFYARAVVAQGVVTINAQDKNALAYIKLVRETMAVVRGSTNATPGALQAAIGKLSVKELQGSTAQTVTATVVLLYELYYGQAVANKVNSTYAAQKLLDALIEGIDNGVAGISPPVPAKP